jgi:lipopolysaccharide exporter
VSAPLVVPVLFGERWKEAVVPLVALALYTAVRAVGGGATEVYKALGRPSLSVYVSLVRLAVLVPSLVLAARWWGMPGVAWAQLATSSLFAVLMQGVALRVLRLRWRDLASAVAPAILGGGAVAVAGMLLVHVPLAPPAALVVVVVGGAAAAVGALALTYPALLRDLVAMVVRRRSVTA